MDKFIYLALLTLAVLFRATTIYADSTSLEIVPSSTFVVAKPGSSPFTRYTLINNGDPVLVSLDIVPFIPIDTTGHVKLQQSLPKDVAFSLEGSSLQLKTPFLMKSNARQTIDLRTTLPSNLIQKDYYYTLVAQTIPFPAPEGETNLQFSAKIGAHLMLSVSNQGALEKKVSIAIFSIPQGDLPGFLSVHDTTDEIPATLIVKNDGRNLIRPQVEVTIKGWNVNKKISFEKQTILASSQRLIIDNLTCRKCSDGTSFFLEGLYLGKYTITASVNNGPGSQMLYSSTSFTALPIKYTSITVFIGIILLFILKKLQKK